MISQRCPKCHSSRIRAGYRHTPLWSKMLFLYNLLCDHCNWEFRGFAVPGTVSSKSKPSRKKQSGIADTDEKDASDNDNKSNQSITDVQKPRVRRKVKVRLRS